MTVPALGHRFKWFAGAPVPPHAMRNFRKPVQPAFIGGQVPYTAQQTLWQGQQSGVQPQPVYAYPSAPFAPFAANAPAKYRLSGCQPEPGQGYRLVQEARRAIVGTIPAISAAAAVPITGTAAYYPTTITDNVRADPHSQGLPGQPFERLHKVLLLFNESYRITLQGPQSSQSLYCPDRGVPDKRLAGGSGFPYPPRLLRPGIINGYGFKKALLKVRAANTATSFAGMAPTPELRSRISQGVP